MARPITTYPSAGMPLTRQSSASDNNDHPKRGSGRVGRSNGAAGAAPPAHIPGGISHLGWPGHREPKVGGWLATVLVMASGHNGRKGPTPKGSHAHYSRPLFRGFNLFFLMIFARRRVRIFECGRVIYRADRGLCARSCFGF